MKIFKLPVRRDHATTAPASLGRYKLKSVLGRGAAATVFLAHDTALGRDVAIKVFDLEQPSDDVAAQEHELHILASLGHPRIVSLLDAGMELSDETRPRAFLVMELATGDNLRTTLASGSLTPHQVAGIGLELADALQYVHSRGIVHRDLTPANVLLSRYSESGDWHAKLGDFGIAVDFTTSVIPDGDATSGTAAYLSPEQVRGGEVGSASDIYSLGLVLLECFTHRLAFPGPPGSDDARLTHDPDVPATLPTGWSALLTAMTRGEAAERPTAVDVIEDLEWIQQGRVARHRVEAEAFATMEEWPPPL